MRFKTALAGVLLLFLFLYFRDKGTRAVNPQMADGSAHSVVVAEPAPRPAPQPTPPTVRQKLEAEGVAAGESNQPQNPPAKINFGEEIDFAAELFFRPLAALPAGQVRFRIPSPDGSYSVMEEFEDGPKVHRNIAANGSVMTESVQFDNGSMVDRIYNPAGYIELTILKSADGSRTTTRYSFEGLPVREMQQRLDGSEIFVTYDAAGRPVEEQRSPDGEHWETFN